MIPRIIIGIITYVVRDVHNLLGTNGDGKTVWCNGKIKFDEAEIHIEKDLPDQVKIVAYLHEAMHAILEQGGMPAEDHDERYIVALSYGVIALLRANPALAELILKGPPFESSDPGHRAALPDAAERRTTT